MTTRKHTPEPWGMEVRRSRQAGLGESVVAVDVNDSGGQRIAGVTVRPNLDAEASARRIVAAVNGCEGIPTDALENGAVGDMLEALQEIVAEFADDLRPGDLDRARAAIAKAGAS